MSNESTDGVTTAEEPTGIDPAEKEISETEGSEQVDGEREEDATGEGEVNATPFRPGQPLKFVKVRFPGNARPHPFFIGDRKFLYGNRVLAMSDRGVAVGYINSFPYEVKFHPSMLPIKSIINLATDEDMIRHREDMRKEDGARELCRELIQKHKLDMELTHVEFIQYGKKAVFYFTAPSRVDFRNLVKDLVTALKMRIELRQISVRDRSAAIGGLGPCGLQLCCSSFLSEYGNVNIKMAKNQNLTFSPTKLNGVCGQLKCCIRYEDEVYRQKRRELPREGQFIKTLCGDLGRVERLHLLIGEFELLSDQGVLKRYKVSQYDPKNCKVPEGWKFPQKFTHISDQRSN